jgi:ferredoxin-like protein FixX
MSLRTGISFTVNIDERLAVNKFIVDEEHAHIVMSPNIDDAQFHKLMLACPAGLYRKDEDGAKSFDYAGCLECGTCRLLCGDAGLESWEYPRGTQGVEYRWG